MNPPKIKIIVGTIYKHPSVDLPDFNSNYFNKRLEKESNKKKICFPFR